MKLFPNSRSPFLLIDKNTEIIAARLHANIIDLNASFWLLWGLPIEELVGYLNDFGPAEVVAIFTAHHNQATGTNALLEDCLEGNDELADKFQNRAITVAAKIIDWGDGSIGDEHPDIRLKDGVFVVVPPLPPAEPEPPSEPTEPGE